MYILVSIDVSAAIWKSMMFYFELYKYENKDVILRFCLIKQVLKQDLHLGNVEITKDVKVKFL